MATDTAVNAMAVIEEDIEEEVPLREVRPLDEENMEETPEEVVKTDMNTDANDTPGMSRGLAFRSIFVSLLLNLFRL